MSCGNRLFSLAAGETNYLNATEGETIDFGSPKVDVENYPSNYAEQWILIVPEGMQVQIDFDIFELEDSEDCKNLILILFCFVLFFRNSKRYSFI